MFLRSRTRLVGGVMATCLVLLAACGGGGGGSSSGAGDAAGPAKNAVAAPTGAVASKLQPQLNGWAFPNFPSATFPDLNFDTADLVSMFGSGPDVCVDGVADPCTLTAEAAAWARMVNQARATGHCEGLVVLASARYNRAELPETVKLPSEEDEIRAVVRAFATQFVPEVQASIEGWTKASLAEKVDELKRSFASDKLEYTLGVYVEGGGHAVLPYAVEYPTPDLARIMVYDSNWPGRNRYVDVDLANNSWSFSFAGDDPASDPNIWTGGSQDMDLTPFEAREGTCPFCGDGTKLQSTTLLVRTENLDWSVETDSGAVSPTQPVAGDGSSARPVKGGVAITRLAPRAGGRSSYDYLITIPNDLLEEGETSSTTAVSGGAAPVKKRAKLKFGGASSVFAVMKTGVAQFTTPGGGGDKPVELGTDSIKSNDPSVDLTLASGNLVANASGPSVELGSSGGTLEVAVTTANGEIIQQQVTPEAPAVQVKADETGGVTVLEASATGEVKKTEVAADGTKTETIVDASELNLNKVEVQLPPALESKPLEALPNLEERNLNNPNYKTDEAYVPPTTVPVARENAAGPTTTTARGETPSTVQTRNAALPTTTVARSVTAAGATPTTVVAVVKPTLANFRVTAKTFGDEAFTLDPPDSNSPGGFRYSSSRPDVATVNATTGRVTIVGAGTTTITATQAGVRGFEAGTITATLTVAKAKPTIAETKDVSKTFGDDPFTLKDPTSNSTGDITYSSNNEDVVKQSKTTGRWVIGGAGRATITVSQAATDDFLAGTDTFTVTVRKGTPDLKAPSDIAKSFLDADFDLPRPTSESKGAFTFTSSDANVVSITGTKASIKSAGTVTITASQAATDDWVAASTTFKVVVSTKAPSLTDFADVSKTFGDDAFTLAAPKSNSPGSVSYKSSDEKVVTVGEKDGRVAIVGAGTATITASQAASGGFSSGSISAKVTIGKADPGISDLLVADKTFGDADFTLKPTAKGGGKFTYSTDKTDIFTVDAETGAVKIVGVGTATLTAKLASTANYDAGTVSASVTVQKGTPTLTWSLDTKTYGDASFDLTPPTSRSAGKFTYSVSTADAVLATVTTDGKVTIKKAGTVTITAKQAATINWNEATTTATLTVDKATPTIGAFTIPTKTYGDANFALSAPSSNSPAVFEFAIAAGTSSEPNVATITPTGAVSLGMAGTVTVRAKQDATENYTSASVTAVLTLNKKSQTAGVQTPFGFTPTSVVVSTPTTLSLVGGAGTGEVTYTVVTAGSTMCIVSPSQTPGVWSLYAMNAGTCTVKAAKAGDRNHLAIESEPIAVTVTQAQPATPPYLNAPTNLQAVVNGNQVTLTWTPGATSNTNVHMWSITWYDMDTGQPAGGWGIWTPEHTRTATVTIGSDTSGYGVSRFTVGAGTDGCVVVAPVDPCLYGPTADTDVTLPAPNTFNLLDDFVAGPNPQSSTNFWRYLEVPSARTSATLLPDWQTSGNEIVQNESQWDNNRTNGNYPFVQKVTNPGAIPWGSTGFGGSAAVLIHPDNSDNGVGVAWTNKTGGSRIVDVSGSLKLAYPTNNTDGISYHIQRGLVGGANYALLESGSIANGTVAATSISEQGVLVPAGESIYVIVGRNGIYYWDHTILTLNVTNAPSQGVVQTGLISHLDATSVSSYPAAGTTWFDISGNNHNATLVGVTKNSAGYMTFSGATNVYANWGYPLASGSSYSIDAWVWRNSTSGAQNIASTDRSPFWFNNGPLCGGVDGNYSVACHSNAPVNAWMHAAVTFDDAGNVMKIYLNGEQVGSNSTSLSFPSQWWTIGAHNGNNPQGGGWSNLNGRISSIRLYNRALTGAEISQNYSATAGHCLPSACGSNALWIDASDGQTVTTSGAAVTLVTDRSGNGRSVSQSSSSMRPTLSSATRNGKKYLEFLDGQKLSSTNITIAQPLTMFAVVRSGEVSNTNRQVVGNAPNVAPVIYMNGGAWRQYAGAEVTSSKSIDTDWHYISAVYNGSSSTMYVDGVPVITSGNPGSTGWSNAAFNIGNSSDNGFGWIGDIGEAMLFSKALTDAERQHTEKYLARKWGFTP